jgi:hypothetical protein
MLKKREEKFNIFSALHKEHDERRLHSRFISVLLQPKGKHGKGLRFLEIFISQVEELKHIITDDTLVFPSENDKKENNNIDILIINKTVKQCIIIENKIYARDSNIESGGQLQRYIEYAINEECISEDKIYVIYLTIDGHEPSKQSLNQYENFKNLLIYSYEDLILPWLDECLKESISQPFLRESIAQYKILIQKMTGNSTSVDERLAYKKLIGSSDDYMNSAKKLIDNFKHVKWHAVNEFWSYLQDRIIKDDSFELIKSFNNNINSKQENNCVANITHYEVYRKGQKEKQKCEIYFKTVEGIILKIKYSANSESFYIGIPEKGNEIFSSKILELRNEIYKQNIEKGLLLHKVFKHNIQFNDFGRVETFNLIKSAYNSEKAEETFQEVKDLSDLISKSI